MICIAVNPDGLLLYDVTCREKKIVDIRIRWALNLLTHSRESVRARESEGIAQHGYETQTRQTKEKDYT